MNSVIRLVSSLVLALACIVVPVRVAGQAVPATVAATQGATGPRRITVAEMVAAVSKPGVPWINSSVNDMDIHWRLLEVEGKYQADKVDEPALLAAMNNEKLDMPARLCVARFLLDLDSIDARKLVQDALNGRFGRQNVFDAGMVLVSHAAPGRDWAIEQMIRLVEQDTLIETESDQEDPGVRTGMVDESLLWKLGELDVKKAVPALIALLARHPDEYAAADSLGDLGDPAAIPLLLKNAEDRGSLRRGYGRALVKLKAPVDQVLPILLRHMYGSQEEDVFGLLEELKDPRAIAPLEDFLNEHPDGGGGATRGRIAVARLEAKDAADLAARLLALLEKERDPDAQWVLFEAIGGAKVASAVPVIMRIARTSNSDIAISGAIRALGNIGTADALGGLVELLDRDYSKVNTGKPQTVTFREEIASELKEATGQDFRVDSKAWAAWLAHRAEPATRPDH